MIPKVLLYKHKTYADGSHPVIIQVRAKKIYREVLFSLEAKHWSETTSRVKKSHYMHVKYNELIVHKLHQVESRCIDARINGTKLSKSYLFDDRVEESIPFKDAIQGYLDKLKSEDKFTSAEKLKTLLNRIDDFSPTIDLDSVDVDWLDRFHVYLQKFNSYNTASKHTNSIVTVLRYWSKKGKYTDLTALNHRFTYKKTTKDKLSQEELISIRKLDLPSGSNISMVRDIFMFAFYCRGMRISDVITLKASDIVGGRIMKSARKTSKQINIKLIPQACELIEKYKGQSEWYIFPLLKVDPQFEKTDRYRKKIESKTSIVNNNLKVIAEELEITKKLTSHVARHTFAYLADLSGMTAKRIQDMLNHSDLKTTQNYIEDLRKDDVLDKEMDKFIESVFSNTD